MEGFQNASWDIACIYTGRKSTNFSCPACVHVEHNQGAKWQLVYSFTQSTAWKDTYQHHYQTVYIPDDDVIQTGAIIDRAFDIHQQYNLKVSQPVLCSWMESTSSSRDIVKSATTVLRYTNFVEIMVPLISMDVFRDMVIPTIAFAETGEQTRDEDKLACLVASAPMTSCALLFLEYTNFSCNVVHWYAATLIPKTYNMPSACVLSCLTVPQHTDNVAKLNSLVNMTKRLCGLYMVRSAFCITLSMPT